LPQAAKDFLAFALGPIGQAAVGAAGLADQAPGASEPEYADTRLDGANNAMDGGRTRVRIPDIRAFEAAVTGAERLSITFRFQSGTDALDSRAEADLGRLIALLQKPDYARSTVTLIGFSSTAGDYVGNRELARERAAGIRDRLAAAGVSNVNAVGIGPGAAIACNLDPATSPLNQRVEVWVFGIYIPELFPTELRLRAAGICNMFGRGATIGTPFVVIYLFDTQGVGGVTTVMEVLLAILALVLVIFGVEPAKRSLEEITSVNAISTPMPRRSRPVKDASA
jgi:outer membrane protein OmpA-like peptidoglycan-associated protein